MQSKNLINKYLSSMDALNSDKLDNLYNPLGYSNFSNKNVGFLNKRNKNYCVNSKKKYSNVIGELNLDGTWRSMHDAASNVIHVIKNNWNIFI